MTPDFWQQAWQNNKIGFNQTKPNPLLMKYLSSLKLGNGARIFVPLCGKSIDMIWLAGQQLDVVGVELVETAVIEFFEENNLNATVETLTNHADIKCYHSQYKGQTIRIFVGDIFVLTAAVIGHIDAIYDRAALVALPDEASVSRAENSDNSANSQSTSLRTRYTQQLISLTHSAPQLLLTFGIADVNESEYSAIPGPPFFVASDKIYQYYDQTYQITKLEAYKTQSTTANNHRFLNFVWHLQPKASL